MASTPATTRRRGWAWPAGRRGARDRPRQRTHDQLRQNTVSFFKKGVGHEEVDTFFFLVSFQNRHSRRANSSPSSRVDAYDTYLHILILNASESFRLK